MGTGTTLWRGLNRSVEWGYQRAAGWIRQATDLLYPPHCVYCYDEIESDSEGMFLCGKCAALLAPGDWQACRCCGAGLPEFAPADRCVHCRGRRFWFDTVVALGPYREELRDAVLRAKYPKGQPLAMVMGRLHGQQRGDRIRAASPDLVVPVPMHWRRYLARRVHGVELVAETMARWLRLPVESRALRRCRDTHLQRNLSPGERFRNVRGAFRMRGGYDLSGARVLLVDDVLTTGATASEAAKVLKRDGAAASVTVAVLARATGEDSR